MHAAPSAKRLDVHAPSGLTQRSLPAHQVQGGRFMHTPQLDAAAQVAAHASVPLWVGATEGARDVEGAGVSAGPGPGAAGGGAAVRSRAHATATMAKATSPAAPDLPFPRRVIATVV